MADSHLSLIRSALVVGLVVAGLGLAGCRSTRGRVDRGGPRTVEERNPVGQGLPEAQAKLNAGDVAGALAIAVAHTRRHPKDARGLYTLGTLLSMTGDWKGAQSALKRCVAVDPRHGPAYNNLGLAAVELGRLDEAKHAFRRAAALLPSRAEPWVNLGAVLLRDGAGMAASEAYEQAMIRAPGDLRARLGLANALSQAGKRDRAVAEYQEVLRTAPRELEAHIGLSITLRHLERYREAIQAADAAVRIAPTNPLALLAAALGRELADDNAGADQFYRRALTAGPKHVPTLYNYSVFLERQKRYREAILVCERYLSEAAPAEPARRDVEQRRGRCQAALRGK